MFFFCERGGGVPKVCGKRAAISLSRFWFYWNELGVWLACPKKVLLEVDGEIAPPRMRVFRGDEFPLGQEGCGHSREAHLVRRKDVLMPL